MIPSSSSPCSSSPSSSLSSPSTAVRKAGYIYHEKYFWHDSGLESYTPYVQPHGSNESSESKRRMHNLLTVAPGLDDALISSKIRYATEEEILRIHTSRYVNQVKSISSSKIGGQVGHEMHIGPGGYEIAALAAGGLLTAAEEILSSNPAYTKAYCLVRPPGHHAEADQGHGFCCFNNIGICIAHVLANKLGNVSKVAVIDWDVHHGNGTQDQFYDRNDVLFLSLHQEGLYPLNTGFMNEIGVNEGKGYNINIPLPPGSGWGAYEYAFQTIVLPALRAYKPDMIFVSSGFDPSFLDTLGRMMLTSDSFRNMTRMLADAADELCQGRLLLAHEGGYSEIYVPFCGLAVMEELTHVKTGIQDPFIQDVGSPAWVQLQPHQKTMVDRAAENLKIAILPEKK